MEEMGRGPFFKLDWIGLDLMLRKEEGSKYYKDFERKLKSQKRKKGGGGGGE